MQQLALQQVSQAATTQGQPAPPQPQMSVQTQVPTGPDPAAAAAAQQQQQQIQMHRQAQQAQKTQQEQKKHQQQQQQQKQKQKQQQAQHQAQLHQQQLAAAATMGQNRMTSHMSTSGILRLLNFADHLSQSSDETHQNQLQARKQPNDLTYWHSFVEDFFSQKGVLRQLLWSSETKESKQFELSTPSLPRYYWAHFNSGITNIQMSFSNAIEKNLPGVGRSVESPRSSFVYWFTNGHQVAQASLNFGIERTTNLAQLVSLGNLRCQFDQNWKIDLLELNTVEHSEYVPRQQLLRSAAESPDIKQSPSTSKALGKRAQQQRQKQQHAQDQPPPKPVPSSMVTGYGMTEGAQTYLEVCNL